MNARQRVFAIGWQKTGTTTIGHALNALGYRVVGCRLDLAWPLLEDNSEPALELMNGFDACQDVPWAALFRELDTRFPYSKFILTYRHDTSWLESASRHFKSSDIPLHRWLYGEGRLSGNEALYLDRYRQHNQDVRTYFADRENDLLQLQLENGLDWQPLCSFLGVAKPDQPFPHENKSWDKKTSWEKLPDAMKLHLPPPIRRFGSRVKRILRKMVGQPEVPDPFHNREENRREIRRYQGSSTSLGPGGKKS